MDEIAGGKGVEYFLPNGKIDFLKLFFAQPVYFIKPQDKWFKQFEGKKIKRLKNNKF